jgi:sec-independent protein translocase protein TatA
MPFNILAFPLGGPEMILIFLVILLLFGAKKLPQLARGVGKSMGEFKKAKDEFESEIKSAVDEAEKDWDKDKDKESSKEETKGDS